MATIHITDIEAAINFWRSKTPSSDGVTLSPAVCVLAGVYAEMALRRAQWVEEGTLAEAALSAWMAWYESTPDTPCIAICSTSQGDAVCKGCGRTETEVQLWTAMGAAQKRSAWRRITLEGSAWRFNKYAERVRESS